MSSVPFIEGYNIPSELYYSVGEHVWATVEPDGNVKMGITQVATNCLREIFNITHKPPGTRTVVGDIICELESVSNCGGMPYIWRVASVASGLIVEVNEKLVKNASNAYNLLMRPYGDGWIAKVKPDNLEETMGKLLTGQEAIDAYIAELRARPLRR